MTEAIEEVNENSPANSEVLSKYQAAAEIANKALAFALTLVKPGASILEICKQTDEQIKTMASKIYIKGKISKGIAFPCCVSINNILGYFSPADEQGDMKLSEGDLAKIELGAHIDGFPTLVGTSVIVGASKDKPVTGTSADLVNAANLTGEVALRLFQSGKTSRDVAETLKELTKELGVKFAEGMISHSITKNRLADEKMIVVNPAEGQTKMIQPCTFSDYDVFVVDISLSSGDGTIKTSDTQRTNIYKRSEENYALRLKTSRAVISEAQSQFGLMAFNVRQMGAGVHRTRMALNEATQHKVTSAYEVLEAKDKDALIARVMFTVIVLPTGPSKITDYQLAADSIKPTNSIKSQHLIDLFNLPVRTKKDIKKEAQ